MNAKTQKAREIEFLVALASIPDIGPLTIKKLIASFGSARAVFEAPKERLLASGIGQKRAGGISGFSGWEDVRGMLERAGRAGIKVLAAGSAEYPAPLMDIPDYPPVLYMKGDVLEEDKFAIGIVGTRTPTHYGRLHAENIAAGLAKKGFTIVSGLARGIDSAAHKGALRAGGRSIGVMGSGLDVPYPPENHALMQSLASSGAVLSEFPPGTGPSRENFPRRNRIISALSLGVLVVEAGKGSGSLITANCALEQGKEVFAVPGNISSSVSSGTNELIKNGAKMVTGIDDIIEELAPVLKGFLDLDRLSSGNGRAPSAEALWQGPARQGQLKTSLDPGERRVVEALGPEPVHIDELARQLGMGAPQIMGLLLHLELKGIVKQAAGKKFFIC